MISDLWNTFPRLIEQRIHGLLEGAFPNRSKAFRLYKLCQNEELWRGGFEAFSKCLEEFFAQPLSSRRKSGIDFLLERPMSHWVYSEFNLNFRTAEISEESLLGVASWSHHLVRVHKKTTSPATSLDVFIQALRYITNPPFLGKAENINFDDFCSAWKRSVQKVFGNRYDTELNGILLELKQIDEDLKRTDQKVQKSLEVEPILHLTQTELEWICDIQRAVFLNRSAPKFPLARGPQKQPLQELERVVRLYEIIRVSKSEELLKHRANVHATLLDRCERLFEQVKKQSA
jgi:hypothetical protein